MDWISVDDKLPDNFCKKYLAKKIDGDEIPVFFMPDKMMWANYYGIRPSYWIKISVSELVYDVTHWKLLSKK